MVEVSFDGHGRFRLVFIVFGVNGRDVRWGVVYRDESGQLVHKGRQG